MSVDGDSHPPNRETQLRARLAEMLSEVEAILKELRGGDDEDSPEKRRRAFRYVKGGLILILIGASLGMANAAGWAGRHVRTVAGAAVTVGAAGVIAGALLAQGSPGPHSHAGVPPVWPHATPTVSVSASPSKSPGPSPSAHPRPGRTRGLPPTVSVLVPTRGRRPSPAASGAGTGPVGPSPTPSRPGPTPSSGSPPPPPPFVCPAGLVLQVLGIGVYVCV